MLATEDGDLNGVWGIWLLYGGLAQGFPFMGLSVSELFLMPHRRFAGAPSRQTETSNTSLFVLCFSHTFHRRMANYLKGGGGNTHPRWCFSRKGSATFPFCSFPPGTLFTSWAFISFLGDGFIIPTPQDTTAPSVNAREKAILPIQKT